LPLFKFFISIRQIVNVFDDGQDSLPRRSPYK
jgi:hypothetical protein